MAINVKKEDFDSKVIQESQTKPVLVDFWASWCNPCKVLSPLLDKLETDYQGRFLLVKINTETEQELANRYKISSIPYIALFHKGTIKDSFLGALNENLIKNFLEKNLPHPSSDEIESLIKNSMYEIAEQKIISENLRGEAIDGHIWNIYKYYLQKGEITGNLKKIIDQMMDFGSKYSETKNILVTFYKNPVNATDLKSILKIFQEETKRESLDYFLDKIEKNSGIEKEKQKNYLFLCFLLIDKDPLIMEYRKKLSRILF